MAKINDFNTNQLVGKYLDRPVTLDKERVDVDTSDEISSILESISIAFLLNPRYALSCILRAKNNLQQILAKDLELATYLQSALLEVSNPDLPITDTSNLVEAQAALVELDKSGTVSTSSQSFQKYQTAINGFLEDQLSKTLKRKKTGELERSGYEARSDYFTALNYFLSSHKVLQSQISQLLGSVDEYRSIDLSKMVAAKTIARVRSSLKKLQGAANKSSKTTLAIELLAGAASLISISGEADIYDPLVSTADNLPNAKPILASSAASNAIAKSGTGATKVFVGDPQFNGSMDGVSFSIPLPTGTTNGNLYLLGSPILSYTSQAGALYINFWTALGTNDVVIPIPPITIDQLSVVVDIINQAIPGVAEAFLLGNQILIVTSTTDITEMTVTSDPGLVGSLKSLGEALGFDYLQKAKHINTYSPKDLVALLDYYLLGSIELVDDTVIQITSPTNGVNSSLAFSGNSVTALGFPEISYPYPEYLELTMRGGPVSADTLGVSVGDSVSITKPGTTRSLRAPITGIQQSKLYFAPGTQIPNCSNTPITIYSGAAEQVQTIIRLLSPYSSQFDKDIQALQRVSSPLASNPTQAQIEDAKRVITAVQSSLNSLLVLLQQVVSRDSWVHLLDPIARALEERGLDRGVSLLSQAKFSEFFSMTKETASKGSRLMKSLEEVGRNDLASPTAISFRKDVEPLGVSPDVLPSVNASDDDLDIS